MTIELKLDTGALSALIESDPTFRLKLQQAVLENIASRYIKNVDTQVLNAVESVAEKAKKEILEKFGSYQAQGWSGKVYKINNEVEDKITKAIKSTVDANVRHTINEVIKEGIKQYTDEMEVKILNYVTNAMNKQTSEVVGAMIKERVNKAISDIKF